MRIVSIIGTYRPLVGGTETHAASMGRLWADRGHEVEIWTRRLDPSDAREETEGHAVVRRLGWARGSRSVLVNRIEKATFAFSLFTRLLRAGSRSDVVMAYQTLYPALIAATAKRFNPRPLVLRNASTGVTSDYRAWGLITPPVLRTFRRAADAIVVTNREGAQEALARGFPETKVERIPNGLDPGPPAAPRPLGRPPRFAYVGGLRPEKRVDLLLRAWARAGAPGELALAGDGPLRSRLESLARELNINPRFLGNVAESRALLREYDVFVLASDAEGMSNALLEAMAASCACLATFVGGNTDCLSPESKAPPPPGGITKGSAGWLVACGDEEAMALALRALAQDPGVREQLGQAARERVVGEYDVQNVASAYLRLFTRLIA